MGWQRTSPVGDPPVDPVGEAVADVIVEVLQGSSVELVYTPNGVPVPEMPEDPTLAKATGAGPPGWQLTAVVRLGERIGHLVTGDASSLHELLATLPVAALRATERFRFVHRDAAEPADGTALDAPLRRALRDAVASEILSHYLTPRIGGPATEGLIGETIGFLIELSSTRVESHDLTHGVVISNVARDTPRLEFAYPGDVRAAKRAPLLFDGQRSVLIVDRQGRARTELQRHRFKRLVPSAANPRIGTDDSRQSGGLVADATWMVGGLGFFLRSDRSIWTFVDGQPLLVRRSEHWTAFPLELSTSVDRMIGGGAAATTMVRAAFMISAQPQGAILAIVGEPADIDGVVPAKDRYDLRNEVDPAAMRTETRLHHLIDAEDLDERTLVRLAILDGATILDRDGRLLAYGAIVASADSQYEGARTAAARTLSEHALVVLKASVDGDITIFRDGRAVTTLLGPTIY